MGIIAIIIAAVCIVWTTDDINIFVKIFATIFAAVIIGLVIFTGYMYMKEEEYAKAHGDDGDCGGDSCDLMG